MYTRRLLTVVLLICLCSATAMAANVVEEKKPAIGAHVLYSWVPGGLLNIGYDQYTHLSSLAYGVYASYGFGAYDLQFEVNNWNIMMGAGNWTKSGGTLADKNYLKPMNLGMVDFDMSVLWKWRVHEAVEPYVGPTFGFGAFYGKVKQDSYYDHGPLTGQRQFDWQTKHLPPVIPFAGLMGGCRFYPMKNLRLSVDLGFMAGLFGGVSMGYAF
jgi:hypothetical protein